MQFLVLLVPVLLGFMGLAVDLGRLYMARAELKSAANSMALAAAQRLIGTETSLAQAQAAMQLTVENSASFGNKYDYGGRPVGSQEGALISTIQEPQFYASAVDAAGESQTQGTQADAAAARYVRVRVAGEAPIIFWGFLSLAQERKVNLLVQSVAGISIPLCTACGIEPLALQAIDTSDTLHFGFTPNTRYTLGYQCQGAPTPGLIPGTTQRVNYLLLNRFNPEATLYAEESSQLYRIGAGGLPGSANAAVACMQVNAEEPLWPNALPQPCNQNRVPGQVQQFLCGLASRFDPTVPAACETIPEVATIATNFQPDPDVADVEDYLTYTGNARRVITVAVVESLAATGTMTVLGFRQFLVVPNQNDININPTDSNGRFGALYIGSVVPLRQGRFDGCPQQLAGPGKVVLYQ